MLSNGFVAPLCLRLKPSRRWLMLQVFAQTAATIALLVPSGMPLWIRAALLFLVCFGVVSTIFHVRNKTASTAIWCLLPDGRWCEQMASSADDDVTNTQSRHRYWSRLPGAVITPWFVLFHITHQQQSRRMLIFSDQMNNADDFRRLCVRLRYFTDQEANPAEAR